MFDGKRLPIIVLPLYRRIIYEDRSVFVYINVETVYPLFPPTELYSYVVFIAIDEKKS